MQCAEDMTEVGIFAQQRAQLSDYRYMLAMQCCMC